MTELQNCRGWKGLPEIESVLDLVLRDTAYWATLVIVGNIGENKTKQIFCQNFGKRIM